MVPIGIKATDAARASGVIRKTLSAILNGKAGNKLISEQEFEDRKIGSGTTIPATERVSAGHCYPHLKKFPAEHTGSLA
jgi:hypothetical protein